MKKFLLKTVLLLLALIAGSMSVWGQVSSASPEDGKSYVVAAYSDGKYYALSSTSTINGSTVSGIEVSLNALNKVGTSDAAGKTWTLEEGATSGQFYLKCTIKESTCYLYKNGTGKNNVNFAIGTTNKNYWTFETNGTGYTVTAVDRGSNNMMIQYNSDAFRCYSSATPIILLEIGDIPTYTLTIHSPSNGTISVTNGSAPVSSGDKFTAGTSLTVVASANTGYNFAGWTGTTTAYANSALASTTFSMPASAATIDATFISASEPSVALSETILAFGDVEVGQTKNLTFTVTPANLTDNLSIESDNSKYTVSPTTIAVDAEGAQTITVTAAPTTLSDDMSGTITISGGGIVDQEVMLSASLYQVANVTLNANGGEIQEGGEARTSLTSRIDGSVTLTAVPGDGFIFLNWSAVGATPASSTNAEEEFTFTSATPTLTANFVREAVAPMAVTSAYTLVTDAATLVAGDKLLIVSSKEDGTAKTLSATEKTNNRDEVDVVVSDEAITSVNAAMQIINLEGSADEWYFNVGTDKYLYAGSSSSNYMYTGSKSTAGNNGKAKITIANGIATIKFQGSNTHNWIQYNSGSKLFSCYSSGQKDVYLYRLTTPDSYDVTIGSTGWRTLVSSENVSLPDGVKAYIVTETDGDEATLTEVASVKANTPVLLNGPAGSCALTIIDTPAEPTGNLLQISTANVSDNGCYVLAERNEKVGFYLWEGGSLGAGRVILPASAVSGVREFIGIGGGPDGINMVQGEGLKVQDYYDLSGRRVVKPTKGLYIVNGKKIMVK